MGHLLEALIGATEEMQIDYDDPNEAIALVAAIKPLVARLQSELESWGQAAEERQTSDRDLQRHADHPA